MKFRSAFLLLFTILLLLPSELFACACCAEKGHYSINTAKPAENEIALLKKINFSDAELYITAAGTENISGLNPIGENYQVSMLFNDNFGTMSFKDIVNDKRGTLNLFKPGEMTDFKVDIHDGKDGGAGSPLLYKELRFKGGIGDKKGIFHNRIKGSARYFLILQGRGNICTNAEDFTNWRMEVRGNKANYTFFGTLKTDLSKKMQSGK